MSRLCVALLLLVAVAVVIVDGRRVSAKEKARKEAWAKGGRSSWGARSGTRYSGRSSTGGTLFKTAGAVFVGYQVMGPPSPAWDTHTRLGG
jgi:hypothetical protein